MEVFNMSKGYGGHRNYMYAMYDVFGNVIHDTYANNATYVGEWETGTKYFANDLVSYNGSLYRCIKAIDSSEKLPDIDTIHFVKSGMASVSYVLISSESGELDDRQLAFVSNSNNVSLVLDNRVYTKVGTNELGTIQFMSYEVIDNESFIEVINVSEDGTYEKTLKKIVDDTDVTNLQTEVANIKDGTTHLFENITDSAGNKRFVDGDITMETITGITQTYGKWTLSGTHLMIVVCADVSNGTTISNRDIAFISLPAWILTKINLIPVSPIESKNISMYDTSYTIQTITMVLAKREASLALVTRGTTVEVNSDRKFRIQFDLLIDDDYE
jgi:hypothetical protein